MVHFIPQKWSFGDKECIMNRCWLSMLSFLFLSYFSVVDSMAMSGDLDPTFGVDGKVISDISETYGTNATYSIPQCSSPSPCEGEYFVRH